jgi:hypothetical protein
LGSWPILVLLFYLIAPKRWATLLHCVLPCHDVLPHQGRKAMELPDHRLKPFKLWVKMKLSFF